jgi:bacillopeptidase F (M6 metalloprotease family)
MRRQSLPVLIPGSNQRSPRLSFKHYVATENAYDGGNLKVSVNDGSFEVVPDGAYIFNKPNATMAAAPNNTSPLAGEKGFTGTDGGEVTGSWGQSQIDLTMLGVQSGDSVELRFDFGMDGCGAVDGWYVDDVTVSTCKDRRRRRRSTSTARLARAPRPGSR